MNIVARADWKRAGEAGVREDLLAWMRTAQLSERMIDVLRGCLPRSSELVVALRSSRAGFEGDAVVIARLSPDDASRAPESVPCSAKGWRPLREERGLRLFEPEHPSAERPEPALIAADQEAVAIASQAAADWLLRIVHDGPDPDRLRPPDKPLVALDARLGPDALPDNLRGRSPVIADLARGLEHVRVQIEIAESVRVRSALSYAAAQDAKAAGVLLTRLRPGFLSSEKKGWSEAARSSHAALSDTVLRLTFEIPR